MSKRKNRERIEQLETDVAQLRCDLEFARRWLKSTRTDLELLKWQELAKSGAVEVTNGPVVTK